MSCESASPFVCGLVSARYVSQYDAEEKKKGCLQLKLPAVVSFFGVFFLSAFPANDNPLLWSFVWMNLMVCVVVRRCAPVPVSAYSTKSHT